MKKNIITPILVLFLICGLKAQNIVLLPTFEGKNVVVRIIEYGFMMSGSLSASDGIIDSYNLTLEGKAKATIDYAKIVATVINQLENQGYKLSLTNGSGSGGQYVYSITFYIFKKE